MNPNSTNLWIIPCIVLLAISSQIHSQSIRRQSISSYGSSTLLGGEMLILQTAGQAYGTVATYQGISITPGFQQPISFRLEEITNLPFKNLNISVYPNPTSHSITITSKEVLDQPLIQVSDINGKYILSEKMTDLNHHWVDCSTWANGIYLITVSDILNNRKTIRLIISK